MNTFVIKKKKNKKTLFLYLEMVNFMVYELYLNLKKLYDRKKKEGEAILWLLVQSSPNSTAFTQGSYG